MQITLRVAAVTVLANARFRDHAGQSGQHAAVAGRSSPSRSTEMHLVDKGTGETSFTMGRIASHIAGRG